MEGLNNECMTTVIVKVPTWHIKLLMQLNSRCVTALYINNSFAWVQATIQQAAHCQSSWYRPAHTAILHLQCLLTGHVNQDSYIEHSTGVTWCLDQLSCVYSPILRYYTQWSYWPEHNIHRYSTSIFIYKRHSRLTAWCSRTIHHLTTLVRTPRPRVHMTQEDTKCDYNSLHSIGMIRHDDALT